MPTDGEGNRQDRPNASPDDRNSQELPASQVSSTRDSGSSASSSAPNNGTQEDKDAIIESLRKEAAKQRVDGKRLAELERLQQEAEDAKLSEKERYEKQRAQDQERISALELARQEALIRADVKLAARELGITEKLARLVLEHDKIEYDENGDPTNIADLLRAIVEENNIGASAGATAANVAPGNGMNGNARNGSQPHVSSGGAVNPGRSNTSNNGLFDGDPQTVAARFARMSPSEYAQHSHEYTAWLINNQRKLTGR